MNQRTEETLVALLMQRDEAAMEELYERYGRALHGIIFQIVKSEELAYDTLQEVLLKIWKKIDQYDATRGRLFTWMLNIARNAAIDVVRSPAYQQWQQSYDIATNAYHLRGESMNVAHIGLEDLVAQLRPEHREMIDVLYFKGYTQQEAAEALNMPLGTVKTRVRAALNALRKIVH